MTDGLKERYRIGLHRVLERFPKIERGVLFGSRAMGTFRGPSDIDLALEGNGIRLQDLVSLLAKIEELNLPVDVELVVRDRIKDPAVEGHIRHYGIEWYRKPASQRER